MTITVTKSTIVTMTTDSEKALEQVVQHLEKQSEHVKEVTVLANFSIDKLASLQHDTQIVQGIIVQVDKEYAFSKEDMAWFHPEIATGRSVYEVESIPSAQKLKKTHMDGLQSSIGSYTVSKPDEFGCESVQHHIVVDNSVTESLQGLYNKWLATGVTAGEIDKQWKRMKFGDVYGITSSTCAQRTELAKTVDASAKLVYEDTVRSVLSDTTSVYFTNNVVKHSGKRILMKSSALGGYRMYSCSNETIRFYPATLGAADTYYSWNNMTPQNCSRIEKSCSWEGVLSFNAAVMTGPAINGPQIRQMEDSYEITLRDTLAMVSARFSPTDDVRDAMSPSDILGLTPDTQHVGNAATSISTPLSMKHPVINNLMHNIERIRSQHPSFNLFNPKLMKNGRLEIPKDIYKELA